MLPNILKSSILINRKLVQSGLLPTGLTVQFSLNIGCNANCIMCDKRVKGNKSIRTYTRLLGLLDFIESPMVSSVKLLGGEPLLDKDGLLAFLKKCNTKDINVNLVTNGSLLTEEYIDLLVNNKLGVITISLDSYNAKEHDKIRGYPGLFNHILNILKYVKLKHPTLRVNINSLILRDKTSFIKGIIRLVNGLGITSSLNFIYPEDFGKNYSKIALTRNDIKKISEIKNYAEARESRVPIIWDACNPRLGFGCRSRFTKINIDEDGKVVLCGRYPLSKNYLLNKPLAIVLREQELYNFFAKEDLHCDKTYSKQYTQ